MALNASVTLHTWFLNSTDVNNQTDGALLPKRSTLSIGLSSLTVGLICLVTILGNIAVIYAIVNTYEMREKASNIFLINLSITDLSNALFVMFSAFVCIAFDFYQVNTTWCNFMCAMNYCLIIVSMMTLALISVDRLLSVLFPFRYYSLVTKGRVVAVIVFTWFQGLVFGLAPAIEGWVHYDYWEAICAINWHHEPRSGPINYVIAAFAICFILPALTMLVCYTLTIRYAKKSLKNMVPVSSSSNKENSKEGKRQKENYISLRTITSLLVVVALFFVCLTPFSVTKLLKVLTNDPHYIPPYVNFWSACFAYLSSMVNPFIYGIFRADFRHSYRMMFRRIAARKESRIAESSVPAGLFGQSPTDDGGKKCNKTPGKPAVADSSRNSNEIKFNTPPRVTGSAGANNLEVLQVKPLTTSQTLTTIANIVHYSGCPDTLTKVSL